MDTYCKYIVTDLSCYMLYEYYMYNGVMMWQASLIVLVSHNSVRLTRTPRSLHCWQPRSAALWSWWSPACGLKGETMCNLQPDKATQSCSLSPIRPEARVWPQAWSRRSLIRPGARVCGSSGPKIYVFLTGRQTKMQMQAVAEKNP